MSQTASDAEKDGVVVPRTLEEYCVKSKVRESDNSDLLQDFYDDDDYLDDDDDDYVYETDDDDSGNEES